MLPHLIRRQLPDRSWTAADLDAAAEFWFRLYEAAAPAHRFSKTPTYETELRLRGFPRRDRGRVRDELARRAAGLGLPDPNVDLSDPVTLVLTSGTFAWTESPPAGLGLPRLAGPPFDGLMAEVRVRVVGNELRSLRSGTVRSTLVLVGELRGGALLLKAVWRTGSSGWEDELYWKTIWVAQDEWLDALERFRETDAVPAGLAKKVFAPRRTDRSEGLVIRLIRVPRGKPRLGGLLARCLVLAALLAGLGSAAALAIREEEWRWLPFLVPLFLWTVWVAAVFVGKEAQAFFRGFNEMYTRYKRIYDEGTKLVPVTRPEADDRLAHPWGRKICAEMAAAGFTHAGDTRADPPLSGANMTRVFLAPDGITYVNVLFITSTRQDPAAGFQLWPASFALLAHTYFTNGARVTSVSGRSTGYRRKRTGPDRLVRVFPDVEDPVEFDRLHAAAVEEFGRETGRAPLRHERFDQYLRRMNDDQEEQRHVYGETPYTWGDHVCFYLQHIRREYRGSRPRGGASPDAADG